jgi:two-component system nitrogen regulation response regulator NtrX
MVIMADEHTIDLKHLPANFTMDDFNVSEVFTHQKSLQDFRELMERKYIKHCLEQFDGNISQTARILQVDRTYLHRKLKKMNIKVDELRN